jgi:hypothetical protein
MSSKIVQDVIPPNKRSIRRIPIPAKKRSLNDNEGFSREETPRPAPPVFSNSGNNNGGMNSNYPKRNNEDSGNSKKRNNFRLWLIGFVCLAVLVFSVLSVFASSSVKVIPKSQTIPIDVSLTASRSSSGEVLRYDVIRMSREQGTIVQAGEEEEVSVRASGRIMVYNNHSESSQPLVATTRFETPEGLIYRIQENVSVPGITTNAEGETVPGSIEVTVYADQAGEDYNIGLSDFTIPGFVGTPRFDNFYARSVTEMTGGFQGVMRRVGDETLASARQGLQSSLENQLKKDVFAQIPETFVLYENGIFIDFEELPQSGASQNSVTVNEKAVLHAILIDKESLNTMIVEEMFFEEDLALPPAQIMNLKDMTFNISSDFNPNDNHDISFTLRGEGKFVWLFDEVRLKEDLAGSSKRNIDSVMANYPSVQQAEANLNPFWKRSFPKNPNKISVEVVIND